MRIKGSADSDIEVGPDARQEVRIDGDADSRIAIAASFQGSPIAVPGDEEIVIVIDDRELFNHADSGSGRYGFVGYGNMDAHIFRFGAVADRTYFSRAVPDSWQGETVQIFGCYSHNKAGLTGAGSPPDDQTRIEIGYAVTADLVAVPDLGTTNDGTAPFEISDNFQLGTTEIAPLWRLHGSIAIGAADRFIHFRVTRNGLVADDAILANLFSWFYAILLP